MMSDEQEQSNVTGQESAEGEVPTTARSINPLLTVFWNPTERRIRAFWRLGAFLVILILMMSLVVVTVASTGSLDVVLTWEGNVIMSVVATVAAMWVAGRWIDRRAFADFGLHLNKDWWLDLGFGLALGALLMAGIFLVEWGAGWVRVTDTLYAPGSGPPFVLAMLAPLIIFLGVGIYEELMMRGYLFRNIAEGLNRPALGPRGAIVGAWVLSSVIFGMAHMLNPNASLISTVGISLAGIFLGLGYVLTGELALPIGLHITWNLFQGNVFGFPVSGMDVSQVTVVAIEQGGPVAWTGGDFGPEAGLMGILANVVGCALIVLWVRMRSGRVALQERIAIWRP